MHFFTIHYQTCHRTARCMSGRVTATVTAHSPWGALRRWWRVQRQFQPLVKVVAIRPRHTHACQVALPTTWAYTCNHV